MTEQDETRPEVPAELVLARQNAELHIWQERQQIGVERQRLELDRERMALQIERESGLMERKLGARMLAESGLVPSGYRVPKDTPPARMAAELDKAAANILLAQEIGKSLGYEGLEALQHLQVIEGNIGLAPVSARGRIMAAGHPVEDSLETNDHGVPVAWTIRTTRNGQGYEIRFTLFNARRMNLCTLLFEDGAPETLETIVGVEARSKFGKPLPWETATEDMLCWRASARLKRIYADLLSGLSLSIEHERPLEAPAVTPPAVAARLTSAHTPAPNDQVMADLETAGPEWWQHAGSEVRRRNKVQMAADRLMAEMQRDPEHFPGPLPPPERDRMIVEAARTGPTQDVLNEMEADDEPVPPEYTPPEPEWLQAAKSNAVPQEDPFPLAAEESERTSLLVLLDDYASRTGQSRDALTLRSRAVLSPPAGPVIGVEEMTTEQLAEMLDALGPMVETWSGPDA